MKHARTLYLVATALGIGSGALAAFAGLRTYVNTGTVNLSLAAAAVFCAGFGLAAWGHAQPSNDDSATPPSDP